MWRNIEGWYGKSVGEGDQNMGSGGLNLDVRLVFGWECGIWWGMRRDVEDQGSSKDRSTVI